MEQPRELAYRQNGDLEVMLLWSRLTGEVTISVVDHASGMAFVVPVPPEAALDAFHHPFAHAPRERPSTRSPFATPLGWG